MSPLSGGQIADARSDGGDRDTVDGVVDGGDGRGDEVTR